MESKMYCLGGNRECNKEFPRWPIYREEYLKGIEKVFRSNFWGGIHEDSELHKFEKKFADYNKVRYAVGVSNGTIALIMAIKALDIEPLSEIIVPAMSFVATATAVSIAGMVPVFVDIYSETHCISVEAIKKNISSKTRAIIPVHIGGYPCDMNGIMAVAEENNLYVIEDCCQAHGAEWNYKKVGSFGHVGVFSFASSKNMTAGEGGALITNSRKIYEELCALRNHGRINSMDYYHNKLGCNFRMNEFQANLLNIQLKYLEQQLEIKNKNVKYLVEEMKKIECSWLKFLEYKEEVTIHSFFSFAFLYDKKYFGNVPKWFICKIIKSEGIPVGQASVAQRAIFENPIYSDPINEDYCINKVTKCENTIKAYEQVILIGQSVYTSILLGSFEDMDCIVKVIKKINKNKQAVINYYNDNYRK